MQLCQSKRAATILILLGLTSLACVFSGGGNSTPTPEVAPSNLLIYVLPVYAITLEPGQTVPGTGLHYVDKQGDVFNVTIDGVLAPKRFGDSFAWQGVIAPGVIAEYDLRLSPTFIGNSLVAAGRVEISVLNPIPVEASNVGVSADARYFGNIEIVYNVAKGQQMQGTTLVYEGQTDQGAQFTGISGYPYRAVGDSLVWEGRLRGNVTVRYNLRVLGLDSEAVRLAGTAELWVEPAQ
ncbi:MAG: hypothetical protein L0332_29300 [Chloroflexi bacterium]|nr:hypothetical protein [Chloroflexota bacterium]MCI0578947.1 hypothetical protein [Chloroflexota bacterium]MCI0646884.1 hypothetical protein [Chloroflexota bacterium]MCI0730798.1 hypothetical protein [Chloroflexota bacterium]